MDAEACGVPVNRDWFDTQMRRMVALKVLPESMDEHYKGMQDIPAQTLDDGITHAIKTRIWFPTVAELRADCDAVNTARPQAVHPTSRLVPVDGDLTVHIANPFGGKGITVKVTQVTRPECDACDDTGWVKFWCGGSVSARWPWMAVHRCQRRQAHAEHEWAGHCSCVETNSRIHERRTAQASKYSQEPERVA